MFVIVFIRIHLPTDDDNTSMLNSPLLKFICTLRCDGENHHNVAYFDWIPFESPESIFHYICTSNVGENDTNYGLTSII
jgi:hypothetical protein